MVKNTSNIVLIQLYYNQYMKPNIRIGALAINSVQPLFNLDYLLLFTRLRKLNPHLSITLCNIQLVT